MSELFGECRSPAFVACGVCTQAGMSRFVGHDATMVPMDEASAAMVEAEFAAAWNDGQWKRRVTLPNQDVVELRSPQLFCIYEKGASGSFPVFSCLFNGVTCWPSLI